MMYIYIWYVRRRKKRSLEKTRINLWCVNIREDDELTSFFFPGILLSSLWIKVWGKQHLQQWHSRITSDNRTAETCLQDCGQIKRSKTKWSEWTVPVRSRAVSSRISVLFMFVIAPPTQLCLRLCRCSRYLTAFFISCVTPKSTGRSCQPSASPPPGMEMFNKSH